MSPGLFDDYYKHDLFIHYYNYDCFQTSYIYRNEIINYKNLYLINLFKINNFYLQDDF